jgi:hypothetical protein
MDMKRKNRWYIKYYFNKGVSTGGLNLKANFDKAVKKTSRN